jgi:phosphohistidine phosphatase SixA
VPEQPVSVFLVRHAETAASTRQVRDPELSEEGRLRAHELARLLSQAGVTHLFASEFVRTGATLAPLAEQLGLEVRIVPAAESEQQVQALRALPAGSVAVLAGHSNTVPELVVALGGELAEPIEHEQYQRVFLVTLPRHADGAPKAIELRYGD